MVPPGSTHPICFDALPKTYTYTQSDSGFSSLSSCQTWRARLRSLGWRLILKMWENSWPEILNPDPWIEMWKNSWPWNVQSSSQGSGLMISGQELSLQSSIFKPLIWIEDLWPRMFTHLQLICEVWKINVGSQIWTLNLKSEHGVPQQYTESVKFDESNYIKVFIPETSLWITGWTSIVYILTELPIKIELSCK